MKRTIKLLTCTVLAAIATVPSRAELNIPSNGSDGALVVQGDTVIDLRLASIGKWDIDNKANEGGGVYDQDQWAVVFKYTYVDIQGGTVTFINHPSGAPVVWLVQGDVTINGTVSLDGQDGVWAPGLAQPGPGGFHGGSGNYGPGAADAAGFGPGGGGIRLTYSPYGNWLGGGGSYGSVGGYGAPSYGNAAVLPLVGGSGGGGRQNYIDDVGGGNGGGAGGGAILIASSRTITISGSLHANGGKGTQAMGPNWHFEESRGGAGSGGAIRLLADELRGGGVVEAVGGTADVSAGGLGRIRLERVVSTLSRDPVPGPSVVELFDGATPHIWLPANGPTVRIVSIGGDLAPADPRAGFGAIGADIVLPQVSTVSVVIETTNVEKDSVVTARATPRSNGNFTQAQATWTEVVSEDPLVLRWTANVPVNDGYSAIQVKVVRP